MTKAIGSAIFSSLPLPTAGPYPTGDPYLFCVYHKDHYPTGNMKMEAPRRGNGSDFDPSAPYRMYHGEKIPGFPQHPHRGFETITATMEGLIDHADSAGNGGRYGQGDLQWMTAGKGIVHSEMFPLINTTSHNRLRFFQIWLNLPSRNKMVEPSFAMFWANDIPKYTTDDGKASATIWVGTDYFGVHKDRQNKPPPDSWASDSSNDVALVHITLQPGGKIILPKAKESTVNRSLFYIEGKPGMLVDGKPIMSKMNLVLDPTREVELQNTDLAAVGEFLWMQGKPIEEPVAQYGPFAMNTDQEIHEAFSDYRKTKFGGWPWPRNDMVFPRDKGRFAFTAGKESFPEDDNLRGLSRKSCPKPLTERQFSLHT